MSKLTCGEKFHDGKERICLARTGYSTLVCHDGWHWIVPDNGGGKEWRSAKCDKTRQEKT